MDEADNYIVINTIRPGVELRLAVVPDYWDSSKYNLTIREFFESYDGEWFGTRTGIDIPYDITTVSNLYIALTHFLAKNETLEPVLARHLQEALKNARKDTT